MIFDAILGFICSIPKGLLYSFSSIGELAIPQGIFDWWKDIFSTLSYVFPVYAVLPILLISGVIKWFEIMWAGTNRIKGIFWGSN